MSKRNHYLDPIHAPKTRRPLEFFSTTVRPTVLFLAAFALNVTPHEAVHALAAYLLGINCTLFQMWVSPDHTATTPHNLALIAAAGPAFSLLVGTGSLLLYKNHKRQRSGLLFLMLGIVGVYSFLGPMAGSPFGGDFHTALEYIGASLPLQNAISTLGLLLLSLFMFTMGTKLVRWAPTGSGRAAIVICTVVAPWILGTLLVLITYWPLPPLLVSSTLTGSLFWIFAVLGAISRSRLGPDSSIASAVTRTDGMVTAVALLMVRFLVHGLRLAH